MVAFSSALTSSGGPVNLTSLGLDKNYIGDVGMKAFARAIEEGAMESLTRLELERNEICDEGMEAFSEALSSY